MDGETSEATSLRKKAQWQNDCGFKAYDQTAVQDPFVENMQWQKAVSDWAAFSQEDEAEDVAKVWECEAEGGEGLAPVCTNARWYNINLEKVVQPYNKLVHTLWNQADICLIIRTAMFNGMMPDVCTGAEQCKEKFSCADFDDCKEKFPNPAKDVDGMATLVRQLFDQIKCPGSENTSKICALNGDSQDNPRGWVFNTQSMFIKLNGDQSKEEFVRQG